MRYLLPCLLLSLPLSAQAGLDDLLKQATEAAVALEPQAKEAAESQKQTEAAPSTAAKADTSFIDKLSLGEIDGGLKEALKQGTQAAVSTLSATGGFANSDYKIKVPKGLAPLEQILRKVGQEKIVDDFVSSMNKAAEDAVPEATAIFSQAIDDMSVTDATNILKGDDKAATRYFQDNTESDLKAKIAPVVKKAMDANGVSASYNKLMETAKSNGGALLGNLLGDDSQNIDEYVTKEALDALFARIAEEEQRIRANPAARSTEILQKVFNF